MRRTLRKLYEMSGEADSWLISGIFHHTELNCRAPYSHNIFCKQTSIKTRRLFQYYF